MKEKKIDIPFKTFKPISYTENKEDGDVKTEVVVEVDEGKVIKTEVEVKKNGDVSVKGAVEKPGTFTGMEKNPVIFKPPSLVQLNKFNLWRDKLLAFFKAKGYKFTFTTFKPITYNRTRANGKIKYDLVIKVDDGKVVKTKLEEKTDGTVDVESGMEKPSTFTGEEENFNGGTEEQEGATEETTNTTGGSTSGTGSTSTKTITRRIIYRRVTRKYITKFTLWRVRILAFLKKRGIEMTFDKFEPLSYHKTILNGKTKYDFVVKVSDKKTIKTKVQESADGKVEVEEAEEKPADFNGFETNPVFKRPEAKMIIKFESWRTRLLRFFQKKNINFTFKTFKPVSFTKEVTSDGKTKYDVVVKVDDNKTI
jgi:hypothetical protein